MQPPNTVTMALLPPIPPKPSWYAITTTTQTLPSPPVLSRNSLIESQTETPATENCKNKSYDNIENDRPDDDDNDVDCFPWQDKQPVLPQDIVHTAPIANDISPSLIESSTDNPATKNKSYDNIENNRPDDDNNNNDVDCFPRQDKQPVLPQDISPTAPTANANTTPPSSIESPTDKSTDTTDHDNDRRPTTDTRSDDFLHSNNTHIHPHDCPRWQQEHKQLQAMFPQFFTNHVTAPSPIRPISTWNGTTHTDIVYDDDDDFDGRTDYDYAYGDSLNMNDPSVRFQFEKCLQHRLQATQYIDTMPKHTHATPQTTSYANQSKHATTTTMKETPQHNDPPYRYETLQLSFLTTHYESADDYIDAFPLYTVPHYITRKKTPSHDNYLYRRWNNPTLRKHKTKKTRTKHQRLLVTTKDDTSVTPTLETLSTQDTRTSHPTNIDTDTILSITIWNQPIAQYRIPPRPNTRHRSREHPSTAVQYALIGVYDKLLHPPNVSCLLPTFTRIVCVVFSCSILLADSFTLVKIDDRYPDEWNDW